MSRFFTLLPFYIIKIHFIYFFISNFVMLFYIKSGFRREMIFYFNNQIILTLSVGKKKQFKLS